MAITVYSRKDGYINETGVMSGTVASATASGIVTYGVASAQIRHCVMLPPNTNLSATSLTFTSGYSTYLNSGCGRLAIGPGTGMKKTSAVNVGGILKITAVNATIGLRMMSVGTVIQPTAARSGASIPGGDLG
jgi:hypothetical protein